MKESLQFCWEKLLKLLPSTLTTSPVQILSVITCEWLVAGPVQWYRAGDRICAGHLTSNTVTPGIKTKKQRNQLAQHVRLMIDQPNKKYYSLLFSLPAQTESRTITAEQSLHSPAEATFFSDRRSYWRVYSSNQRKNSRVDSAAYLFSRSSV